MPPPKEAFHKEVFVWKYADPRKTYKGKTNHWSIIRVKADENVALERLKDKARKGGPTKPTEPHRGCTQPPFLWSRDKIYTVRTSEPFGEVVLQGSVMQLPGDLSKDKHKYYNKEYIHWPSNEWRKSMFDIGSRPYWYEDPYVNLPGKHRRNRNELPL
ncbi:hypothetical protein V1264_003110 [Littorina saxatilis]|uniref:Uncharacterized protein n=1 Tax=Littorina saxatilis TaxID=31220 RepID=A0AAN9B513_9CAEN